MVIKIYHFVAEIRVLTVAVTKVKCFLKTVKLLDTTVVVYKSGDLCGVIVCLFVV